jgi:tRNA (adenine57-N1/adenine58-N1)-methyltransferase
MMFLPYRYKRLKRGPQVILPKDIGMILAYTAIGKESSCLDAGTGSGWLAIALARVSKQVVSYETRGEFIRIAERNIKLEGISNLILKNADVTEEVTERDLDLVALDMPNSEKALPNAFLALKSKGYVCGYLPHIEQVKAFVAELERLGFMEIATYEIIERDMLVREQGTRPSTKGVWHTGYLTFGLKP